ncbi:membrane protein [Beggiatoa sp. PS]|nr:membrane protein [Beggiatoa sp. PS]
MLFWVTLITLIVMLGAAFATLFLKNYLAATAAISVVSLALSVFFVILQAPDVALAEAAVGAGISSVILALTLRRVGLWKIETPEELE